jgi:signal peptidase I
MGRRPRARSTARAERPKSAFQENLESILWAAALALVIRTFIIAPFKIPSGSMRQTLIEGDRILVNKFLYRFKEPARGDIIVFRFPENPKRPFIKRLIGLGGDTIEIKEGRLVINGQPDPAVGPSTTYYYNQGQFGQEGLPTRVPENMYFVLGDNSASSHDSRFWGFVPKRFLIGQAICIFWPPTRLRALR